MAQDKKRTRYTSPKGDALFGHIVEVDYGTEKYPDPKGSYNITLALDPDEAAALDAMLADEVEAARAHTEEKFDALKPQAKKKFGTPTFNEPGPEEYDKEGVPTGRRLYRFKTSAFYEKRDGSTVQRRVPLFDSMQQPVKLTEEPGYGSTIRVAFTTAPYFVDGQGMGGLSLYLDAIQIIRLLKAGERAASDYGFGAEEGGFTHDELERDARPAAQGDDLGPAFPDGSAPDDVPF